MKTKHLFSSVFFATLLYANPQNPTVIEGNVTFDNPSMTVLEVTSMDTRSIVEWDSFSIDSGETTVFTLPNAGSQILNRVTGQDISQIYGTITSNGGVYLINEAGVYIDDSGIINTGSFLAASMDTDNSSFINDLEMTFTGADDYNITVVNQGTITASDGDIILLSIHPANMGDMTASQAVGVGAGIELVYARTADQRIAVVSHTASTQYNNGVDLGAFGEIHAKQVELRADGNFYQYAINTDQPITVEGGIVQPSYISLTAENGLIQLNGDLKATDYSGDYGGMVEVLGDEILFTTDIDVSSTYGGGRVYMGGGWQGNDPNRFNAQNVTASGTIECNTVLAGDAGLVVLWADDTMNFSGAVDATAGFYSGDGGTVEISGVLQLYYSGTVDVSSNFGNQGTLVLDPQHLEYHPVSRDGLIQTKNVILE